LAVIFVLADLAGAQKIRSVIKIEPGAAPAALVEVRFLQPNADKNLAFLRSLAGTENLAERISDLTLKDKNERPISYKKLVAGEYLADQAPAVLSYKVDLGVLKKSSAMAHVSWINEERGVLMLDDLLPQFAGETRAEVVFDLPVDWKIAGAKARPGGAAIDVANIEKAVFAVGKNWREREVAAGKNVVGLAFSGEFLFSDEDASAAESEILGEYEKIFGAPAPETPQILLLKYPGEVKTGNWEAETRGSTVLILSSDMPFKTQSQQRLHEQLRHELFHLWIPNGLALSGNYDWFYEGFALYQSLRTAVDLNRIRFEDFLDTLARAYDLDNMQSRKISLIEASNNRWSGLNSQIYARGMLVAFFVDAALLKESRGKRRLTDVFRELYQKHQKPNRAEDGNASIINILEARAELRPLVERYIKGAENLAWQIDLESFGIETNGENFPSKLVVKAKLTGRQKDLLNELGYNNWRKLSRQSK
jgi:predicted metalloprotease with PDZ domain